MLRTIQEKTIMLLLSLFHEVNEFLQIFTVGLEIFIILCVLKVFTEVHLCYFSKRKRVIYITTLDHLTVMLEWEIQESNLSHQFKVKLLFIVIRK